MPFSIVWSDEAERTALATSEYVAEHWPPSVLADYGMLIKQVLANLEEKPEMYPKYQDTKYRRAPIHKTVALFYEVAGEQVILHRFHANRTDPQNLPGR